MQMFTANTFPQLLKTASAALPDKVFLHAKAASGESVALTFRNFEARCQLVSAGLLAQGIRRGDRVAIAAPNQVEWLELFFGSVNIGAVVVTLNVRYRENELEYMLNQSGARLVVSSAAADGFDFEAFYAGFRNRIPTVKDVFFLGPTTRGKPYADLLAGADLAALASAQGQVRAQDPAIILYTSGTTGKPKGATLTHGSVIGAAAAQVQHYKTTENDVFQCVLPLNHVGGITCNVTAALLNCSTLVMAEAFSPAEALAMMERYRVSIFLGVPTMYTLMLSHASLRNTDTTPLRLALIGGSNVEPALASRISQAFGGARLNNLYGLSEMSGAAVGSAAVDPVEAVSSSIGVTYPGIDSRVVDDAGNEVPDGKVGELQLRGPGTVAGYWEMPDATAETFLPGGWLATGDMVSRDADGHIRLLGRRKEMFIQGGYNVYPAEVESVLTKHPAVSWRRVSAFQIRFWATWGVTTSCCAKVPAPALTNCVRTAPSALRITRYHGVSSSRMRYR